MKLRCKFSAIMFFLIVLYPLSSGLTFADVIAEKDKLVREAVVKIYAIYNYPDYFNPWRMAEPENGSGSGCIIENNKILTNAHVVANASFIEVQRYGEIERYPARVLNVLHEADLALLTVDDKEFFRGIAPLDFGGLPETQQEVLVYGFPFGGDSLSITKGVLSRLEHQYYTHSSSYFFAGQIDAAINPGNSGGPVIVNNKIVGVVMQGGDPGYSENIGYMVPVTIIEHFLKDIGDGRLDGFPEIGILTQKMENPGMRQRYKMIKGRTGVLINKVLLGSPAKGKIEEGDVLLAVDGHSIADDGTIEFRSRERTNFGYYIEKHYIGETVQIDVLRDGLVKKVEVNLDRNQYGYWLVAREQYDRLPRYFIYAGIVFTPLTKDLIQAWGPSWMQEAPIDFITELYNWPTEERKEIVVALKVLGADINKGYHDYNSLIITDVNNKKFKDFNEFFEIITNLDGPFIEFKEQKGYHIVIDRQKAEQANKEIMETYRIGEDKSPDFRKAP